MKTADETYFTKEESILGTSERPARKVFDHDMSVTKATDQTSAFFEAGMKELEKMGIKVDHPGFNQALTLYIQTAENAYRAALDVHYTDSHKN